MSTDPITTEVIRHALETIAEEMGTALRRTALSVVVKDMRDYSCALFDAKGRLLSAALDIPTLLASMAPALQACMDKWGDDIHPGDVFMSNHPYMGAAQTSDINIYIPVFVDDRLVGFTGAVAHHADWGGRVPGTAAFDNRSAFEEGLMLPAVKLEQGGEPNRTLLDIMTANVRHPKQNRGDLRAQVAAARAGEARLRRLAQRYGTDTLVDTMATLIDSTGQLARRHVAALPDGSYRAHSYLDDNGLTRGAKVRLEVTITVDGDDIIFDFAGTDAQMPGGMNIPSTTTRSAVQYAVRCLLPEDTPFNEGALEPAIIRAPEGCVVNPTFPAAVSDRHIAAQRLADVLVMALAKAAPDKASAGWFVGWPVFICECESPKTGDGVVLLANVAGGAGAAHDHDGADAVDVHLANCSIIPAEIIETNYPLRIDRYELIPDSGGPGRFRGGQGIRADYRNISGGPLHFQAEIEQSNPDYAPSGHAGGGTGTVSDLRLLIDGVEEELPTKGHFDAPHDAVVSLRAGGGGGFGPVEERATDAVLADVQAGRVSAEAARQVWGVDVETGTRLSR